MKEMEYLYEALQNQLADIARKVKNNGMSSGDLESIDKISHSLKSLKCIMDEGDYSGRGSYGYGYANRKRDSMGRYSRADLADKMRELMDGVHDERTRQDMQRLIEKLD